MKYRVLSKQTNTKDCFVCGIHNDAGIKAEFFVCENQDKEKVLITRVQPRDIHQSYPDRMHGGVIASLLDEAIGRAAQIIDPNVWAVTIDLNVKYRKAVPLSKTIYIETKITNLGTRAFEGEGKVFVQGENSVFTTATARYFRVPYDAVVPADVPKDEAFFIVPGELPEYITIANPL